MLDRQLWACWPGPRSCIRHCYLVSGPTGSECLQPTDSKLMVDAIRGVLETHLVDDLTHSVAIPRSLRIDIWLEVWTRCYGTVEHSLTSIICLVQGAFWET